MNSNKVVIHVSVGSKNPVKTEAARLGIERAIAASKHDDHEFIVEIDQHDVSSGISLQPMGDEETLQGAVNRAKNAYQAYFTAHNSYPDFSVGLEGGVTPSVINSEELECFAWIVIYNGKAFGRARTGSFLLPPAIRDMIVFENMELGEADDKLFKTINSKQKGGSVGQFTKGEINRTQYYEHAVLLAFVPFQWTGLYGNDFATVLSQT